MSERVWHSTTSAAEYTRYSPITLRRAAQAGELHGSQRAQRGRWRFHRDDLDAWLRGERPSHLHVA